MISLLGFGYVAAMLCGGLVFFNAMPTPFSAWLSGTKVQQLVRMVTMTMAMVHCWCLYFAGAWVMAASDIAEFLSVYEDSALLKVILACVLTVYAFVLIFVLEYLASLDATGPKADQAIYTIMGSLGILVGFTWEQVRPNPNPSPSPSPDPSPSPGPSPSPSPSPNPNANANANPHPGQHPG